MDNLGCNSIPENRCLYTECAMRLKSYQLVKQDSTLYQLSHATLEIPVG